MGNKYVGTGAGKTQTKPGMKGGKGGKRGC